MTFVFDHSHATLKIPRPILIIQYARMFSYSVFTVVKASLTCLVWMTIDNHLEWPYQSTYLAKLHNHF